MIAHAPKLLDASVAELTAIKITVTMTQKPTTSQPSERTNHAFTVVEIMFVIVVLGIVGIGLTSLMIKSSRSMLWSVNKSMITNDFRQFTGNISRDTLNANHAYLYPDLSSMTEDNRREIGLSGDCLVLVSTIPFPTPNSQRFYERIVVYFRDAEGAQNRPVFRTEIVFPTVDEPTTTRIEEFLAAERNNFEQPEMVLELSRGLSENQLFFRATDEAFLINGEIIHGENTQRITNTYNLTISTRG